MANGAGIPEWVVQEYLSSPLLYSGFKFDVRLWVLVTGDGIFLHREGVLRIASVPYNLDSVVSDPMAHITNHCVQKNSAAFGAVAKGNELFLPEFRDYLSKAHPAASWDDIWSQFGAITTHTILSAEQELFPTHAAKNNNSVASEPAATTAASTTATAATAVSSSSSSASDHPSSSPSPCPPSRATATGSSLSCFQLYGFDFMITADYQVKLIEANGAPAAAEKLREEIAGDLIEVAIDPIFPPPAEWTTKRAKAKAKSQASGIGTKKNGFEKIHAW